MEQENALESKDSALYYSKKTAILVDLSFFIKVYQKSYGEFSPKDLADRLNSYLLNTLKIYKDTLFRFYIYDCEPLVSGRKKKPISGQDYFFADTPLVNLDENFYRNLNESHILQLG